jgi:hypothetical protein
MGAFVSIRGKAILEGQTMKSLRLKLAEASQVVMVLVLLLFAFEREASAYTDPGSGALIWQMLVAAFVGSMFYVRRFTAWFKAKRNPKDSKD